MGKRIHSYFVSLGLSEEEASVLHHQYYTQYGLALRGLTRHHDIDPMDFDRKCDRTLPLEQLIKPNPALLQLFKDLDRSKVRVWALTNAYEFHARRVLQILQVEDQIEGLVYCDYSQPNFSCKPEPEFYHDAMKKAGVSDPSKCFFVDDSRLNIEAARRLGWGRCAHFLETGLEAVEGGQAKKLTNQDHENLEGIDVINNLEELRTIWPDIFVTR